MFDSGARQPAGGGRDGGPVSVVPPGPKLALNGPDDGTIAGRAVGHAPRRDAFNGYKQNAICIISNSA